MRRRALLATAGLTALAGCTGLHVPTICSRPSSRADRLDFETHEFSSVNRWSPYEDAVLATEAAHVERFELPEDIVEVVEEQDDMDVKDFRLTSDERAFIENTDFEESILVGVRVLAPYRSTEPRVTHVVNEGESVHCYVCVNWRGPAGSGNWGSWLIRVHDSWTPEQVRVTFTNGSASTDTFESAGTGLDSG